MDEEKEELEQKVKLYEYILNNTSAIVFLDNVSNEMLWCNKRHETLFGLTEADVNKKGFAGYVKDNFHADDIDIYTDSIKHLSDKSLDQSLVMYRQKDKHGNWRKLLNSGKVSKWDENNKPVEGVFCSIDITDQFAEFTRFEELLKENLQLKNKLKISELTKKEIQIIKQVAKGKSTKEIANDQFISFNTVEWHRKNIFRKLGLNKISELVRFAIECGF